MYYIIYLAGAVFLSLLPVVFFGGSIVFPNLYYFLDYKTLASMILICILALLCSKLLKPFGQAFLFMFGKNKVPKIDSRRALLAIKTVTSVSILYGILLGAVEIINSMYQMDPLSSIGNTVHLSLLPTFYAMFICIMLLPIQIALKNHSLSGK